MGSCKQACQQRLRSEPAASLAHAWCPSAAHSQSHTAAPCSTPTGQPRGPRDEESTHAHDLVISRCRGNMCVHALLPVEPDVCACGCASGLKMLPQFVSVRWTSACIHACTQVLHKQTSKVTHNPTPPPHGLVGGQQEVGKLEVSVCNVVCVAVVQALHDLAEKVPVANRASSQPSTAQGRPSQEADRGSSMPRRCLDDGAHGPTA